MEYINRALDKRRKGELDVSLGTQTFSFFQELTESVASLSHGMLVVTLPSSQSEDFGEKEEQSLARLGKIFGRLESIERPVRGQEIYAIIRRRLFEVESLKRKTMREIVHQYFSLYLPYIKLAVLHSDTLPSLVTEVLQKQSSQLWSSHLSPGKP